MISAILATKYGVNVPTTQSVLNYVLLSIYLIRFLRDAPTMSTLCDAIRSRGIFCIGLCIADVEANYLGKKSFLLSTNNF